jgi:putative flippase GtrA
VAALLSGRARIIRFALTGATAGLLQLGLLNLLERYGWPVLVANGVAFLLATQANFWLSQVFTWRDRRANARGLPERWLRFHAAVAGSALLNMATFAVVSTSLSSLTAATLGIAASAAVNFASGDRLVFR